MHIEIAPYTIRKQGNEWYIIRKSNGEKLIGPIDNKQSALKLAAKHNTNYGLSIMGI